MADRTVDLGLSHKRVRPIRFIQPIRRIVQIQHEASGLKLIERAADVVPIPPPWLGVPPDLPLYPARGHRRLNAGTYHTKCVTCIWGCRMPVEMIIDQWNPSQRRYRFETFCYGPKSCSLYRAGATRKVPGRHGMVWEEEDWVDEDATAHRGDDE